LVRCRIITIAMMVVFLVAIGSLCAGMTRLERLSIQAYNSQNLIRLHVLANSNSIADQVLKLKVRDRLISVTEKLLLNVEDPAQAETVIRSRLKLLADAAGDELERNGRPLPVSVKFGRFIFPERSYPFGILNAGEYKSLKVILGNGRGRNWWCVLYPPLCLLEPDAPTFTGKAPEAPKIEYRLGILEHWVKTKGLEMDRFWQGWSSYFGLI